MNASQKSFFSGGTVIVPPGQIVPYNCTGAMFVCKEADGTFYMSFDDGEFFPMEVGLGFRLQGADSFRKLSFRNDSASIISIQFYAGVGEMKDARLNTVIDRLVVVGLKDLTDYVVGTGTVPVPPTVSINFPVYLLGTNAGKQRKQIAVTNLSDTSWLFILDAALALLSAIPPTQTWTVQSSATFYLAANAANVPYALYQSFYTS